MDSVCDTLTSTTAHVVVRGVSSEKSDISDTFYVSVAFEFELSPYGTLFSSAVAQFGCYITPSRVDFEFSEDSDPHLVGLTLSAMNHVLPALMRTVSATRLSRVMASRDAQLLFSTILTTRIGRLCGPPLSLERVFLIRHCFAIGRITLLNDTGRVCQSLCTPQCSNHLGLTSRLFALCRGNSLHVSSTGSPTVTIVD